MVVTILCSYHAITVVSFRYTLVFDEEKELFKPFKKHINTSSKLIMTFETIAGPILKKSSTRCTANLPSAIGQSGLAQTLRSVCTSIRDMVRPRNRLSLNQMFGQS